METSQILFDFEINEYVSPYSLILFILYLPMYLLRIHVSYVYRILGLFICDGFSGSLQN